MHLQKIDKGDIWCMLLTFFLIAHSLLLSLLLGGNLLMLSAIFWTMVCFLALSAATHSLTLSSKIFISSSHKLGVWPPEPGEFWRGSGLAVLEWSMGQLYWDGSSTANIKWGGLLTEILSVFAFPCHPSHVKHEGCHVVFTRFLGNLTWPGAFLGIDLFFGAFAI